MENSGDQFEVLADVDLPELQHTQQYSNIADGPFAVEYGDHIGLGAQLNMNPGGSLSFLLDSGVKFVSPTAEVSIDETRQTISFTAFGLTYTLRPLTKADQKLFFPGNSFAGLDEFKDFVSNLAFRILGSTEDPTEFALTVEDGLVLGLFQHNEAGFFRREKKNWVRLGTDESDWLDVEDKVWVPVLSGAVKVYDTSAGEDSLQAKAFAPYIVS